MPSLDFFTWGRQLHVGLYHGSIDPDFMRERTISITYVDRDRNFDHIEWVLDNWDGRLTRPEHLALGLVVSIKMGYIDSTFPWKAFIINRIRGGVGIYGDDKASVGENERKLTYQGRNRNAPGGGSPGRMSWRKNATPFTSLRKRKVYPATSDITALEMTLNSPGPKTVAGKTTSEVVEQIAERNGFGRDYRYIQPTDDSTGGFLTIPKDKTDAEYLDLLRQKFKGFIFKIDQDGLHWHSATWEGAPLNVVEYLYYGGPDVLELTIDGDFRLPIPSAMKGKGYDPKFRLYTVGDIEGIKAGAQAGNIVVAVEQHMEENPDVARALTRTEHFALVGDAKTASAKTQRRFIERHLRAFQLNVKVVGNPKLLARRMVQITGTFSPFVDGLWYISEARHTYGGSEGYVTELHLKQPPRHKANKMRPGTVANNSPAKGAPVDVAGFYEQDLAPTAESRSAGAYLQAKSAPSVQRVR